jgi:hypothetical protein
MEVLVRDFFTFKTKMEVGGLLYAPAFLHPW